MVGKLSAAIFCASLPFMIAGAMAQGAKKPEEPKAPTGPLRTEQTAFDSWVVTCREMVGDKNSKRCSASLQIVEPQSKQVAFVWTLGKTPEGVPTGVLITPTGLNLSKGLELKMGTGAVRKLSFVACDPASCEATMPLDESVLRDARTGDAATATIIAKDGRAITFDIVNKGFDKALQAIRS